MTHRKIRWNNSLWCTNIQITSFWKNAYIVALRNSSLNIIGLNCTMKFVRFDLVPWPLMDSLHSKCVVFFIVVMAAWSRVSSLGLGAFRFDPQPGCAKITVSRSVLGVIGWYYLMQIFFLPTWKRKSKKKSLYYGGLWKERRKAESHSYFYIINNKRNISHK